MYDDLPIRGAKFCVNQCGNPIYMQKLCRCPLVGDLHTNPSKCYFGNT